MLLNTPELIKGWLDDRKSNDDPDVYTVMTTGCFDVLHPGHLRFLSELFNHCVTVTPDHMGWEIVVAVNTDDAVRAIKGDDRPIYPLEERMYMLNELAWPDFILPLDSTCAKLMVEEIKPDVFAKGRPGEVDGMKAIVEGYGGQLWTGTQYKDYSTSKIIQRLKTC